MTTIDPTTATSTQPAEHIMQFFAFAHLPERLQSASRPFGLAAEHIAVVMPAQADPAVFADLRSAIAALPANPERDVAAAKVDEAAAATDRATALRKLLEAKDAAVRALVAK